MYATHPLFDSRNPVSFRQFIDWQFEPVARVTAEDQLLAVLDCTNTTARHSAKHVANSARRAIKDDSLRSSGRGQARSPTKTASWDTSGKISCRVKIEKQITPLRMIKHIISQYCYRSVTLFDDCRPAIRAAHPDSIQLALGADTEQDLHARPGAGVPPADVV